MADNSVSINSLVIETVVGAQTKFKGSVNTDKPLRIDGAFEGEIQSTSLVYVTECGYLNGTVNCAEFQLVGRAEGTITCTELMEFAPTGQFKGDVTTKDIIIVKGSRLEGNCKIG